MYKGDDDSGITVDLVPLVFPSNQVDYYHKEWWVKVEFRHHTTKDLPTRAMDLITDGSTETTFYTNIRLTDEDPTAGVLYGLGKEGSVYYIPDIETSKKKIVWTFFRNVPETAQLIQFSAANNQ